MVVSKLLVVLMVTSLCGTAKPAPSPMPSPTGAVATGACMVGGVAYCVLNANVVQATVSKTICVSGWTATVRPSTTYTNTLKQQQLAQLAILHHGDPLWNMANTEEDHRMPLELGGSPAAPLNLSPETHGGSNLKDADENTFKHKVCSGEPLLQAQAEFVAKWLLPWPAYK